MRWLALFGVVSMLAGCPDDGSNNMGDMAVKPSPMPDMTMVIPIGGDCTMLTGECKAGTTPRCLKSSGAASGFCSAVCMDDADCGDNGTCVFTSTTRGQCARVCETGADCPPDQACWLILDSSAAACFPNSTVKTAYEVTLNCDPTVADCTTTTSKPGGCERQAAGPGMTGQCVERCVLGAWTCSKANESCFAVDNTKDSTGASTGDAMKGAFCNFILPQYMTEGATCDYIDRTTMMTTGIFYFNICGTGQQCDIKQQDPAAFDNKCHTLCYEPGFNPANVPTMFPDGGHIFMGCPANTTCQNTYGLFGTTAPVGLCK